MRLRRRELQKSKVTVHMVTNVKTAVNVERIYFQEKKQGRTEENLEEADR